MNNKGQAVLVEYMLIFFVVVAALVAMTQFVQRGVQARIHDARNFMINSAVNACDANCLAATGGTIGYEYEPYYQETLAVVSKNEQVVSGRTSGNSEVLGAVYSKVDNDTTQAISASVQLPPECAGVNPPSFCKNFQAQVGNGV